LYFKGQGLLLGRRGRGVAEREGWKREKEERDRERKGDGKEGGEGRKGE